MTHEVESHDEAQTNLLLKTNHRNLPDYRKSSHHQSNDKSLELHVAQCGAVLYGVVLYELVNEALDDAVKYVEVQYGEVLYDEVMDDEVLYDEGLCDEVLYDEVMDDERVVLCAFDSFSSLAH